MEYGIKKRVSGDRVYFTVYWSKLTKADKYEIVTSVPAVAGIIELYYMDAYSKLNLFFVGKAWFGGLRSTLRILTDPELEKVERRKKILIENEGKIYYRFSLTESDMDMTDIIFFFVEGLSPGSGTVQHSGRYAHIFLNEVNADHLVTISEPEPKNHA